MKVYFVGMGPGDYELLTLKALNLLRNAELVLYPGTLANPELVKELKEQNPKAEFVDTGNLKLEEIIDRIKGAFFAGKKVVRLVSGDPAFYSAIQEQIEELRALKIPYEVVPGVSSAVTAAAKLGIELTIPEISHTVVFTRALGKTGGATEEEIKNFAKTQSTLVFFLSAARAEFLEKSLLEVLPENIPVVIAYKLCTKEEKFIFTTLSELSTSIKRHGIKKTALILVGKALEAAEKTLNKRSKLYA